jgi:DNA-binding MarR family transcriptional regulator
VLRVLSATGVRVRELPALTGVSKEAVGMSVGFLEREGSAEAVPDPTTGRGKLIRLTAKGRLAQDTYRRLLGAIEERWQVRVGQAAMCRLRASLSELIDRRDGEQTRLSQGLVPWPGGWRARKPYLTQTTAMLRDPGAALPHYPMVLHRGGWPDGS